MRAVLGLMILIWSSAATAADLMNILDYAPPGTQVDRTGNHDASEALSNAIASANLITSTGGPACVYIPPGTYRIIRNPPRFVRAGCLKGEGPTQSIITLDARFAGDLFSWSEAWYPTTPGPTVIGIKIVGTKDGTSPQNALVFYDRNDEVFLDNIIVNHVYGHALYSGVTKNTAQAYMRESHLRSLRFFEDGAPNVPVVEFNSQGSEGTDATNEIRLSQVDIFDPVGPGFVIRNNGSSRIRNVTIDALRIEGGDRGTEQGDLLEIGDPVMTGNVNNISFTSLELINPYRNYAALHLIAAPGSMIPYQISVQGWIGGGPAYLGEGLRIDAGRASIFRFSAMHTSGTNVVIGRDVHQILIDGGGDEACWTYNIDPASTRAILTPVLNVGDPTRRDDEHLGRQKC